ncbi:MAG: hypothetical protein GF355_03225 [Candidatus Eisenbacteria bacterium]|nr:hypothetical protein [Candidatus Eisenbacteria bacterium]
MLRPPGLRSVIIGLAAGLLAASAAGARAQGDEPGGEADTTAVRPLPPRATVEVDSIPTSSGQGLNAPFWIMMRSLVVPGWGQAANHQYIKALVVAAGEGYLLYRLFEHESRRRDYLDRAEERPDEAGYWEGKADAQRERRNDFTWWSALAAAISMGDAYVDAHLRYFNVEFDARDAGEDQTAVDVRIGVRIPW